LEGRSEGCTLWNCTGEFAGALFDGEVEADKAARILKAILDARSPRISDIAHNMPGNPEANYKAIHRFLRWAEPQKALKRLYLEEADFVLADPTDIERLQAAKTEYVGVLKDGKTRGFQALVFGVPYRGRAIPFHFITYSSRTIGQEATSRNLEHRRALEGIKELLGNQPVVLDREFSYESLFADFCIEALSMVYRGELQRPEEFAEFREAVEPGARETGEDDCSGAAGLCHRVAGGGGATGSDVPGWGKNGSYTPASSYYSSNN